MTNKIVFSVRYRTGAYTTQTVHGQRASSTHSGTAAAEALAAKLLPKQGWTLTLVDSSAPCVQVFELEPLQ